ncbi:hypothetical protein [Robertkochia solimangrovi]|uniref:PIN-like domain-containing protein n=1 Tax=Robertkochia solimangrovi TaxID=2213046 RepID=UPI00117C3105|nr:hypothetical protein [Robertkochia solimangrovi]TRZ41663.1 hypothetical protein DMZ48_16785 [Robertkochia solimangrovi]
MIIYFDENMPPHLAEGFGIIQEPENLRYNREVKVKFLPDCFEHGVQDIVWIPRIGDEGNCVITQDLKISRRKDELALYQKHKVGIFFLRGPSKKRGLSIWEMNQALSQNWEEICRIAKTEKGPFGYTFGLNGKMKRIM